MDLKYITPEFVEARRDALKDDWSARNTRMNEMEQLYLLDVWKDDAEAGELRVTSPRAFVTVEGFRSLLLTQPPVISVPESEMSGVEQARAERIEKYLYGCWERAQVMAALDDAEFFADALGLGVVRVVYDERVVEGELPLVVQALDPRNTYYAEDPRRPADALEMAHSFKRVRRQIEMEWGELQQEPGAGTDREKWLDQETDYTEYWSLSVVEEEVEIEPEEPEEEEPLRMLGMLARQFRGWRERLAAGEPGEGEEPEEKGQPAEAERETRTVWRRKVVHCVLVDGKWVKEPVVVPGYERLPFLFWWGVRTPLAAEKGGLSVLFPISGGDRKGDVVGIIGAENMVLAMKLRIVELFANAATWTDDDQLTSLDWNPGAMNVLRQGKKVNFLMPPGPHPAADQLLAQLAAFAEDATLPAMMQGRHVGDLSGLALSALTNPVLMKIASRQRQREEAFETLNAHLLALTEEYAPVEGWVVYGRDLRGGEFEERLPPAEIAGYRRNRVKLSASLPKDTAGEVMGLSALVDKRLLSRRTAIDQIQQVKRLPGQSPEDEIKQMLIESILFDDEGSRKAMAERALREFDEELAAAALMARERAEAAAGPPPGGLPGGGLMSGAPPGPPGPPGGGPMMGMPPGVVPPQAMPQAVGAGNLPGMLRMTGDAEGPPVVPGPGGLVR